MKYFNELSQIILRDKLIVDILDAVREISNPKCWVAAGLIRNTIWDHLHGYKKRTPVNDVDVIYYDRFDLDKASEKKIENRLDILMPEIPWSVKNQARMYTITGSSQYRSINEVMSWWPETATSVAVRLSTYHNLEVVASFGLGDLFNLKVRPTPPFKMNTDIFEDRINSKDWLKIWPMLKIIH